MLVLSMKGTEFNRKCEHRGGIAKDNRKFINEVVWILKTWHYGGSYHLIMEKGFKEKRKTVFLSIVNLFLFYVNVT